MASPRPATSRRAVRDLTRLADILAAEYRRSTSSRQRRAIRRALARTEAKATA